MANYLVIGGSSGIGLQIVSDLSAEGHNIYASYRANSQMQDTEHVHYFYLDVLEGNIDLQLLPESIDGLVYLPGAIVLKPFNRISPDDFLADYQLQVLGAVKIIQHCLPRLKAAASPSIVLFSSVAAQLGLNFHSLIASSKAAVEGLTRALAAEFAPQIRVNCIAPSLTKTPLTENLLNSDQKMEANAQRHPLKRIGTPVDIAQMALFLLSPSSGWVSGQVLHVDGGLSTLKS